MNGVVLFDLDVNSFRSMILVQLNVGTDDAIGVPVFRVPVRVFSLSL